MISALYTGASAVKTYSDAMTVTGSNIANVNTVGFKYNRANFQDLLATSTKEGTNIGQGVQIGNIQNIQTQGSIETTESETDVSIDGNGFFTVKDKFNNNYYTRAGQFTYNKLGFLTTQDGKFVQTRDVDPLTGQSIGGLKRINVLDQIDPPEATGNGVREGTGITVKANMDSNADVPPLEVDYNNVTSDMYNFSTSVTVYDSKGKQHPVTVVFRKVPDKPAETDPTTGAEIEPAVKNNWQWMVLVPGEDLEGGFPGLKSAVGGGFLEFDNSGRLLKGYGGSIEQPQVPPGAPPGTEPGPPVMRRVAKADDVPHQITVGFKNSGTQQTIGLNFGEGSNPDDPTDARTGLEGVTQFSSGFKIVQATADGKTSGQIENVHIRPDGTIEGAFSSGNIRALGRLALSNFKANDKLEIHGENYYKETTGSGTPITDDPGNSGMGEVRSKTLEHSNVDLAKEFVHMIELQRSFQANAKTVTTSDEISSDLVQMKR